MASDESESAKYKSGTHQIRQSARRQAAEPRLAQRISGARKSIIAGS